MMSKLESIYAIALIVDISKADATRAFNATTSAIKTAMVGVDSVLLTGFGLLIVRDRSPCTDRNLRTGEIIQIKAIKGLYLTL